MRNEDVDVVRYNVLYEETKVLLLIAIHTQI